MRNFVVTARERRRERDREFTVVEADTAEHAIEAVAGALPTDDQPGTYEAWPVAEPGSRLRITFAPLRKARR